MSDNKETFVPAVSFASRAVADVEIIDHNTVNISPFYLLGGTVARFGGCAVIKDTGTELGVSPAADDTIGTVFGLTHISIQDLSAANNRENTNNNEKGLGFPPGIVQGNGAVWLRRYTGTILPNDQLVVGPSGYPKKAAGVGTVIGIAATSGVGNVGVPTTSIRVHVNLPAHPSGLAS